MKPPNPTRTIDALIGGKKQNGKHKKEKKDKNRERDLNPATLNQMVVKEIHACFLCGFIYSKIRKLVKVKYIKI